MAAHEPAAMDLPIKLGLARLAHGVSPSSVAQAFSDWLTHLAVSPSKQAELASSALDMALKYRRIAERTPRHNH